MNAFIDCEWNDFGGSLISMAIVTDSENFFYEVLECKDPSSWVEKNVMPVLTKKHIPINEFQKKLSDFLKSFDRLHIVADWPEDIAYFCNSLITAPGERIDSCHLTFEIVRIDSISAQPHNAFFDAIALKEAYNESIK